MCAVVVCCDSSCSVCACCCESSCVCFARLSWSLRSTNSSLRNLSLDKTSSCFCTSKGACELILFVFENVFVKFSVRTAIKFFLMIRSFLPQLTKTLPILGSGLCRPWLAAGSSLVGAASRLPTWPGVGGASNNALQRFFSTSTTSGVRSRRNVAVIAHVDHGKTTLVDRLLVEAGAVFCRVAFALCVCLCVVSCACCTQARSIDQRPALA